MQMETVSPCKNLLFCFFGDGYDSLIPRQSILPAKNLTGALPADLSLLNRLTYLDLSNNTFNGSIPSSWSVLGSLSYLNLQNNNLTGAVPPSWQGQKDNFAWSSLTGLFSNVAAAKNADGRLQVFAYTANNINTLSQLSANSFNWTTNGTYTFGKTNISELIVAYSDNGRIDVFSVRNESVGWLGLYGGTVYHHAQGSPNNLTFVESPVGGLGASAAGWKRAIVATLNYQNRLELFGIGGTIDTRKVDSLAQTVINGNNFTAWSGMTNSMTGGNHVFQVSAARNGDNLLEVWVCSLYGLFKTVQNSTYGWTSNWTVINSWGDLSSVTLIKDGNGSVVPFIYSKNNALYYGTKFQTLSYYVKQFQPILSPNNVLYVFLTTTSNELKYMTRQSNNVWSNATTIMGKSLSSFSVVFRSDGLWQLFGVNGTSNIHHTTQSAILVDQNCLSGPPNQKCGQQGVTTTWVSNIRPASSVAGITSGARQTTIPLESPSGVSPSGARPTTVPLGSPSGVSPSGSRPTTVSLGSSSGVSPSGARPTTVPLGSPSGVSPSGARPTTVPLGSPSGVLNGNSSSRPTNVVSPVSPAATQTGMTSPRSVGTNLPLQSSSRSNTPPLSPITSQPPSAVVQMTATSTSASTVSPGLPDCAKLHQIFPSLVSAFGSIASNCSAGNGAVQFDTSGNCVALSLPAKKLNGTLPDLSVFSRLTYLDLSNNTYTGPIPPSWSNFKTFSYLNLKGNNLSGSAPLNWTAPSSFAWGSLTGSYSNVVAATNADGRLQVFSYTSSGVDTMYQLTANNYSWTTNGSYSFGLQQNLTQIALGQSSTGRIEVFTLYNRTAPNYGTVYHYSQSATSNGLSFTADIPLGGFKSALVQSSTLCIILGPSGNTLVYAVVGNQNIFWLRNMVPNGNVWSDFVPVSNTELTGTIRQVSAAISGNGPIEVWSVGTTGLRYSVSTSITLYSGWTTANARVDLWQVKVIKDANGTVIPFTISSSNTLHYGTACEQLATNILTMQPIYNTAYTRLYLFMTTTSKVVQYMTRDNYVWSAAVVIGSPVTSFSVVFRNDDLWQLFGLNGTGTINYTSQSKILVDANTDCRLLLASFPALSSRLGTLATNCAAGNSSGLIKLNADGNCVAIILPAKNLTGALPADLSLLNRLTYL
ncbi:hypothetical protein BDR26DRAFT_449503 [Obelidium mucronatum]|nr:hypothetical protein BDR26DRAFT_449503 [Obelidium mucronatum]